MSTTTPHARHLAEMRSTLPPRPVVRDTCASDELLVLCVLRYRGDVSYVPGLGWRLAGGVA